MKLGKSDHQYKRHAMTKFSKLNLGVKIPKTVFFKLKKKLSIFTKIPLVTACVIILEKYPENFKPKA